MINPFTQQQIADITGQTSVNVNRVFADLERQGLIQRRGAEIQFTDWNETAPRRELPARLSAVELPAAFRCPLAEARALTGGQAWWARQGLNL